MAIYIYIYMYIYLYIYIYLLGHRPKGVSGSLVDGPMIKGSYFQLILGTPAAWKLGASEYSMALFRRVGAPRLDCFFYFLVHREGVQKSSFFVITPKRPKSDDKSNLGGPCLHLGSKNMTFEIPFGIVFSSFL